MMTTRNNSRLIDADGHAAWATREAAARDLRLARQQRYVWLQIDLDLDLGWKAH